MVEEGWLHTDDTYFLTRDSSKLLLRRSVRSIRSKMFLDMTVFLVRPYTRTLGSIIAREAQLVEQSIEAALVVSSSLISSKLSSSYFSVCYTDFFLTAASEASP